MVVIFIATDPVELKPLRVFRSEANFVPPKSSQVKLILFPKQRAKPKTSARTPKGGTTLRS